MLGIGGAKSYGAINATNFSGNTQSVNPNDTFKEQLETRVDELNIALLYSKKDLDTTNRIRKYISDIFKLLSINRPDIRIDNALKLIDHRIQSQGLGIRRISIVQGHNNHEKVFTDLELSDPGCFTVLNQHFPQCVIS